LNALIFSLLVTLAIPADAAVRLILLDDSGSNLRSFLEALKKAGPTQWDLLFFGVVIPRLQSG
jgi:hypothetical protein